MKPFSFEKQHSKDVLKLTFSGYIDEHAKFPSNIDGAKKVIIDLQAAEGINSIGTKSWCHWSHWLETFKPPVTVEIENCPVIFVKTFNNVLGALANNAEVISVYVPFVSADGQAIRKDVLFRKGTEIVDGEIKLPKIVDDKGHEMEIDVLPNFFNFVKK